MWHQLLCNDANRGTYYGRSRVNGTQMVTALVWSSKSVTPSKLWQFVAARIRVQLPESFKNNIIRKLGKPNLRWNHLNQTKTFWITIYLYGMSLTRMEKSKACSINPICLGNDLPINDWPYSKGLIKIGCLEPSKIMFNFLFFLLVARRLAQSVRVPPLWNLVISDELYFFCQTR